MMIIIEFSWSAHRRKFRHVGGFLVAACCMLSSCAWAAEWSLADLMALLGQQKSGKASFVEKKYMAVLDKPLESSGELSFDAPDRLEKRTVRPRQESMLLEGDNLTVSLPGKRSMNLRLQDHPTVAATVESIRGTLAGDLGALEKNYAVGLSGTPAKWKLTLTPVHEAVTKIVRVVHITGSDATIKTIRFEQADGDHSEMTITKISMQ